MQGPPRSRIELRFTCSKLTNKDTFSKSDPQVLVYQQKKGNWVLEGKTEKINNNLNPIFKTPVTIDYLFEEVQNIKIVVMDIDKEISKHDDDDLIGTTTVSIGSILSQPGGAILRELKSNHGKFAGNVMVQAEEIKTTGQNLNFRCFGVCLDKKDLFGKSDPYYILSKFTPSGFVKVFQSETIKNTLNPQYREVTLKLDELNGGDMNRDIRFDFYDYDSVGDHDFIGGFTTNVGELVSGKREFDLINPKKVSKKGYKNSGVISFFHAKIVKDYSFLDYIIGGCEISLIIGIDCTGSNGDPSSTHSLHYKHPTEPNEYAKAIVSVGNVLVPYDSDGLIPVYGFGASVNGGSVSHCFPMSIEPSGTNCLGVAGVLDTYYRNITKVDFSGPTYFRELIAKATQLASVQQNQQNQKYTILMIITDGEICDMESTIEAIIKASHLPLSIVIVGVGSSQFDNMVELDGDGGLLTNGKIRAERDIVQFVPTKNYLTHGDFTALAAETLREIPSQFLSFMKKYNISPNPPRQFVPPPQPQ
eukprot:gene5692-7083_t